MSYVSHGFHDLVAVPPGLHGLGVAVNPLRSVVVKLAVAEDLPEDRRLLIHHFAQRQRYEFHGVDRQRRFVLLTTKTTVFSQMSLVWLFFKMSSETGP